MSLTSMELNYLVWRYLLESGYDLAAYALEKNSNCLSYEHNQNLEIISKIEPGCLVNLVQKGILFTVAQDEASIPPEKFDQLSLFGALLQEEVNKQRQVQEEQEGEKKKDEPEKKDEDRLLLKSEAKENGNNENGSISNKEDGDDDTEMKDASEANEEVKEGEQEVLEEEEVKFETKIIDPKIRFSESLVTDWHPITDVFAFGKEDSTAVINALNKDVILESVTLTHPHLPNGSPSGTDEHSTKNEVTIVSWSPQGNIIITAGLNGELRAWTPDGKLKNIADNSTIKALQSNDINSNNESAVTQPVLILSLEWSENGQFLLSIDINNQVCLWDGHNLNLIQQIRPPSVSSTSNELLDACWVGEQRFALSTPNKSIKIYSINNSANTFGEMQAQDSVVPIGYLSGHNNNISILKFNSISKLLASASDFDYTIKIWNSSSTNETRDLNVKSDKISDIDYHESPIIGLFWLNVGQDSQGNHLLSVSMDGTVNIWDAFEGSSLISTKLFKNTSNFQFEDKEKTLNTTNNLIFSVKLSPNGKWLAVGDDSGKLSIWDVEISHYSKKRKNLLRCLAVYFFELPDNDDEDLKSKELGICDIAWNSQSLRVSVSYKGTDSIIFDWDEYTSE